MCPSLILDCGCIQPGDKLESIIESINERIGGGADGRDPHLIVADRGGGGGVEMKSEESNTIIKAKRKKVRSSQFAFRISVCRPTAYGCHCRMFSACIAFVYPF